MTLAPAFFATLIFSSTTFAAPVAPRHDLDCIFAQVLQHLSLQRRREIPLPAVFLENQTSLKHFQDVIEPQWNFRPEVFTNAFAAGVNEIFLLDDSRWYRNGRTIDDSLAHELTHYVQVKYRGWEVKDLDESAEAEAVDLQTWFRETYEGAAQVPSVPPLKNCP